MSVEEKHLTNGDGGIPVIKDDFKKPELGDDLILYFHPYNFYSQKILLILHERNIKFTPYIVDLAAGEQFSSWFLNLNPKGDVPVLQDGCFIVPDSDHIINYLDGKFRSEKHPSLKSKNMQKFDLEKFNNYNQLVRKLPIGAISLGSFVHEDLKLNPKAPFIGPVRKTCLKNNEKIHDVLKNTIETQSSEEKTHQLKSTQIALKKKFEVQSKRKEIISDREKYQTLLDAVKEVLVFFDKELESTNQEWLISNNFSYADINLGLLLYRLYTLGFENYFWTYGKLPNLESYFLRFKNRESLNKTLPTSMEILKEIWAKTPSNYKISAGAGFLGMAMFAALVISRQ
uniref:GST N-terminal domain-containing protein n=1 Tax=Megaselia scalaris TaxID=36166 RepID=T1GGF0_MEGSC